MVLCTLLNRTRNCSDSGYIKNNLNAGCFVTWLNN